MYKMVAHSLYFAEASEITCFIWLFHVYFISMTKSVNTDLKATIHTFFIQKKNNKNVNMSIECLFFLCFGPITDMLCKQMNGIQLVCTVCMCCKTDDIPKNIQCFIECKLLVRLRKTVLIVLCNTQISDI